MAKITPATITKLAKGEKIIDPETPGLTIWGNDGAPTFRYIRRMATRFGGRTVKMALGTFGDFSLVDAREWASALNAKIARGIDPLEEARAEAQDRAASKAEAAAAAKIEAKLKANTFAVVWEAYMASPQVTRQAPKTIAMKRSRMTKDVLPKIGKMPITDVTLDDLWSIVERKAQKYESASNHIVADLKTFYNWCESYGRNVARLGTPPNGVNAATHLKKLGEDNERTRFVDEWELPLLLRAMADMPVDDRRFLALILLTGQRLDNVLMAEYDEWNPRLGAWVIQNMKGRANKRIPNVLPLSPWGASLFAAPAPAQPYYPVYRGREGSKAHAKRMLAEERRAERVGRYLFPAARGTGNREGHMRALCDSLAAKMQALAPKRTKVERIIPHDFRRTLKSHLARLKVSKEHRHAVAGHRESGIDKHYLMYEFMDEKREALAKWEAELIRIAVEEGVAEALGVPTAEVVELAKAA